MSQAQQLRELARWYRKFAERTENPTIWDLRMRTAEDLEKTADQMAPAKAGQARAADREAHWRPADHDAPYW
jgi:hypothetical protein